MKYVVDRFITWMENRAKSKARYLNVVNDDGQFSFVRYCPFWMDEWTYPNGRCVHRPPWYRPFNVLLHHWDPKHHGEAFHDHPRWSITIVLKGEITEKTPWGDRLLKPGNVVVRSRKAIHALAVDPEFCGKTWTLFIVGRRNHAQHRFRVFNLGNSSKYVDEDEA